jgi:hypothetical protein
LKDRILLYPSIIATPKPVQAAYVNALRMFGSVRVSVAATRDAHSRSVSATVVAVRLGHSRPTLTVHTCAHVLEVTDRRAAAVLGKSISPDTRKS